MTITDIMSGLVDRDALSGALGVGVPMSDPVGALPALLGLPRHADIAAGWEVLGPALFAKAGAAAIAMARVEAPVERPIGSLTLLYLPGMPVG